MSIASGLQLITKLIKRSFQQKAGFYLEGFANLSLRHHGAVVLSTLNATSISINSAPMNSSGSVRLPYEKCRQFLENAKHHLFNVTQSRPIVQPKEHLTQGDFNQTRTEIKHGLDGRV